MPSRLALAGILMLVCQDRIAHAYVFTPYPCNVNTTTDFDWPLDSLSQEDGYEINDWDFRTTGIPHEGDGIFSTRTFFANQYARYVDFQFSLVDIAQTLGDSITFQQGANPAVLITPNTSTLTWWSTTLNNVAQATGINITFNTSLGHASLYSGFKIPRVRVKCQPFAGPNVPTAALPRGHRATGLLMHQNDIVNLRLTGSNSTEQMIVAWGPPGSNKDITLFWRCGALPTATSWDGLSDNINSMSEIVRIAPGACGTTVFVTILSAGTSTAQFNLMYNTILPQNKFRLQVGVEGGSAGELTLTRLAMLDSAREVFGATEGQALMEDVLVKAYTTGAVPYFNGSNWSTVSTACAAQCAPDSCDICFYRSTATAAKSASGMTVVPIALWFNANVITHEMMHNLFGFGYDEWNPAVGGPTCGHSILGSMYNRSNNLCNTSIAPFPSSSGVFHSHPWNPDPGCGFDTHAAMWPQINIFSAMTAPAFTPDIYNFSMTSFGSFINVH